MPDYKEMYLHLFRESEKAKNIIIDTQRQCEEMYINAPEHELRVLPKQDSDDARIYVTVNANLKMSFFAGMECHFLAVSMRWVCSLDYSLLDGLKPVKS